MPYDIFGHDPNNGLPIYIVELLVNSNWPYTWIFSKLIRHVCCEVCLTLWAPFSIYHHHYGAFNRCHIYAYMQGVVMIRILVAYTLPAFHTDGKFKHLIANGIRHYTMHLVKEICERHIVCFGPPIFG